MDKTLILAVMAAYGLGRVDARRFAMDLDEHKRNEILRDYEQARYEQARKASHND